MTIGSQFNHHRLATQITTVSKLNKAVRDRLENEFDSVWVAGEISNFTSAASGHWYFTLKDDLASVRAVMFRSRASATGFVPRAGDAVEVRCRVTLYEAKGEFQLQVEQMRQAGQGNLFEAFLALKDKLQREGLFDPSNKRVLASRPRAIGVITSLSAAALQDVLTALERRAPHIPVIIYPAMVQGVDAPIQLRHALAMACERAEVDTLLLVRGGGSIEDLWAFNDDALARDIAASAIPIVTGVGHETDFTIADFVADLRAPTPTAAAELVCETRQSLLDRVDTATRAMRLSHSRLIDRLWQRLDRASAGLTSPQQRLLLQAERVKSLVQRLVSAGERNQYGAAVSFKQTQNRFAYSTPEMTSRRLSVQRLADRLSPSVTQQLARQSAAVVSLQSQLRALSPDNTLARGYAIVLDEKGGVVRSTRSVVAHQSLSIMVVDGEFKATASS